MFQRARIFAFALAAGALGVLTPAAAADQPSFQTVQIDDPPVFYAGTSATCGFPVYSRDVGEITEKTMTLADGSFRLHIVGVKITTTFYSTDPAHTGTVITHPRGPFIETDHPDGSVTMKSIGTTGHVTIPGEGLVWMETGVVKVEIDGNGNVTEVEHGNFFPDHSGICPLL